MILIADGGSTKADWIALDKSKKEIFKTTTLGINPSVLSKNEIAKKILSSQELIHIKNDVLQIHFYGAGCGTPKAAKNLQEVLKTTFNNAKVIVSEDTLGAVYASSGKKPGIVCILGTGSNSCYFDGKNMNTTAPSLGYSIMDEASGNYFGKQLLRDFYYKKMPKKIATAFQASYNLDTDLVKMNLYRKPNPNMYLASFAKFMFDYKEEKYIRKMIKKGFQNFFYYRILPFQKDTKTPIYFIGSIAHYFRDILEKVAAKNNLVITDVIQRPIEKLVDFHRTNKL